MDALGASGPRGLGLSPNSPPVTSRPSAVSAVTFGAESYVTTSDSRGSSVMRESLSEKYRYVHTFLLISCFLIVISIWLYFDVEKFKWIYIYFHFRILHVFSFCSIVWFFLVVLFFFVLFSFVLFWFLLFWLHFSVLLCSIIFCSVLFYFGLICSDYILFHYIHSVLFSLVLFCSDLLYFIWWGKYLGSADISIYYHFKNTIIVR